MSAVALPVDLSSVAAARRLVRRAMTGQRPDSTDDAVLLVSELVTNAVRHTRNTLHVRVDLQHHVLRVEVTDDHPGTPYLPAPDYQATGGRGLHIVNELSDDWGVTAAAHGKITWFEMRLPPVGA